MAVFPVVTTLRPAGSSRTTLHLSPRCVEEAGWRLPAGGRGASSSRRSCHGIRGYPLRGVDFLWNIRYPTRGQRQQTIGAQIGVLRRLVTRNGGEAMRLARLCAAAVAGLLFVSSPAGAQDYPARCVTMVSPYAAGGGADLLARVVAQKLTVRLRRGGGA